MNQAKTIYGLEGSFKVDTYDANGNLTNSSDFFSNFITQSGLKYPSIFPFADCFRFLTLGQGTVANSATGNAAAFRSATTGIQVPVNSNGLITTSDGGFQSTSYMGRDFYYGGVDGACGTLSAKAGPIYYRGWSVPTGGKLTSTAVSINEFMVSPSSGSALTGRHAFSRVVRSVVIPANSRSIISYQLQVKILNTGITPFGSGTFVTGQGNVDDDFGMLSEWASQSGYYRQIHNGLRAIDIYGASYTPKWGDGLEPARNDVTKFRGYFSPDNSQFDVSVTGGLGASESLAYQADGLAKVFFGQDLAVNSNRNAESNDSYYAMGDLVNSSLPTAPENDVPINIRYKSVSVPDVRDYNSEIGSINYNTPINDYLTRTNPISIATPGATGYDSELMDVGDKAVLSALTINIPFNYSGVRKQTLTRKLFFAPVNSLGHNSRLGSFVLGFQNGNNYYPYVDCLLYNNSGRALMQHYRGITGISFTNLGSGFLSGSAHVSHGPDMVSFDLLAENGAVTGYNVVGSTGSGLAEHSLRTKTPPSPTGLTYWPNVYGSPVVPVVSNTIYKMSGFTVSDPDRYFPRKQMIDNLLVRPMDLSSGILDYNWVTNYAEQEPQMSGDGFTFWNGMYLTSIRYTGASIFDEFAGEESGYATEVGLASSRYSNLRLTGYIGSHSQIAPHSEGICLRSLPSTYIGTFTPNAQLVNIQFRSGASNEITQAFRIQDMFSGGLSQRLSGSNYTYASGERMTFAVTGLIYDTEESRDKTVYITSMTGNYLESPSYQWAAHSYLSGSVLMTSFTPPTGNFYHFETKNLLPNHVNPNVNSISTVNYGGTYPALSHDNTLELFVDMVWSANCGTALDCIDPS